MYRVMLEDKDAGFTPRDFFNVCIHLPIWCSDYKTVRVFYANNLILMFHGEGLFGGGLVECPTDEEIAEAFRDGN